MGVTRGVGDKSLVEKNKKASSAWGGGTIGKERQADQPPRNDKLRVTGGTRGPNWRVKGQDKASYSRGGDQGGQLATSSKDQTQSCRKTAGGNPEARRKGKVKEEAKPSITRSKSDKSAKSGGGRQEKREKCSKTSPSG